MWELSDSIELMNAGARGLITNLKIFRLLDQGAGLRIDGKTQRSAPCSSMVKTFRSGIGKGFTLVVTKLARWQKASAVIEAWNRTGLTQQQLARRMGTTQPVVTRLESGRTRPSMRTLERLAEATGSRLLIRFEPREGKRREG